MATIMGLSDEQLNALKQTPGTIVVTNKTRSTVDIWPNSKVRCLFLSLYIERQKYFVTNNFIPTDILPHVFRGRLAEQADPNIPLSEWVTFKKRYPTFWRFAVHAPTENDIEDFHRFFGMIEEFAASHLG